MLQKNTTASLNRPTLLLGASYEMISNGTFPDSDPQICYLYLYTMFLWGSVFGPFWSVFFGLLCKRSLLDFTLMMTQNRQYMHFKMWSFPQFWQSYCASYYRKSEFFLWIGMVSSICFSVTLATECLFDEYPRSMVNLTLIVGSSNVLLMSLMLYLMYCGYFNLDRYPARDVLRTLTKTEHTPLLPKPETIQRHFF